MNDDYIVENILKYTQSWADYKSFCLVSHTWHRIMLRIFGNGDYFVKHLDKLLKLFPNENWDWYKVVSMKGFIPKDHPELVSAVVPGSVTITQFTEVLKALSREGISIRQIELILQGIAESPCKGEGTRLLLEDVRVTLGRTIVNKYMGPNGKLSCYVLDAAIDAWLVQVERGERALPSDSITALSEELRSKESERAVILASKGARALLRDCLKLRKISMAVLAHEEVPEDVSMQVLSIIGEGSYEEAQELISSLAA